MRLFNRLRFLPYRVARRIGTADISCVFGIETCELQLPASEFPQEFSFTEITSEEVGDLIATYPKLFEATQANDLTRETINCFAILHGNALAAFSWLATGDIPAEFNHNGDLRAGLPVFLSLDTGFVYNVFVMPEYRGRRLYGIILSKLAERMKPHGITRLLLTTDATNSSSLKALRRMGFQYFGRAWLLRLGPFSMARYPSSPVFGTVRFGKYTGDRRAVRNVA